MVGVADKPPTDEQVSEMRNKLQAYIADNGKSVFDQRDVDRFMNEDYYVHRYCVV